MGFFEVRDGNARSEKVRIRSLLDRWLHKCMKPVQVATGRRPTHVPHDPPLLPRRGDIAETRPAEHRRGAHLRSSGIPPGLDGVSFDRVRAFRPRVFDRSPQETESDSLLPIARVDIQAGHRPDARIASRRNRRPCLDGRKGFPRRDGAPADEDALHGTQGSPPAFRLPRERRRRACERSVSSARTRRPCIRHRMQEQLPKAGCACRKEAKSPTVFVVTARKCSSGAGVSVFGSYDSSRIEWLPAFVMQKTGQTCGPGDARAPATQRRRE